MALFSPISGKENYCKFQAQLKGDNKNVMTHYIKKDISDFFEGMNGYIERLKETVISWERLISVTSNNFWEINIPKYRNMNIREKSFMLSSVRKKKKEVKIDIWVSEEKN